MLATFSDISLYSGLLVFHICLQYGITLPKKVDNFNSTPIRSFVFFIRASHKFGIMHSSVFYSLITNIQLNRKKKIF